MQIGVYKRMEVLHHITFQNILANKLISINPFGTGCGWLLLAPYPIYMYIYNSVFMV